MLWVDITKYIVFYMGINDKYFSTQELSYKYDVSKKTVSRDINEIRSFLSEYRDILGNVDIAYDRKSKKYHMNIMINQL